MLSTLTFHRQIIFLKHVIMKDKTLRNVSDCVEMGSQDHRFAKKILHVLCIYRLNIIYECLFKEVGQQKGKYWPCC